MMILRPSLRTTTGFGAVIPNSEDRSTHNVEIPESEDPA